jgi:hypothetical protein
LSSGTISALFGSLPALASKPPIDAPPGLKTADGKPLYEFGGPVAYRYRELLATVASHLGSRVLLVPIPFVAWHAVAFAAEFLAKPPITRTQVELMQVDNVADPATGFGTLGIEPCSVEHILPAILRKH